MLRVLQWKKMTTFVSYILGTSTTPPLQTVLKNANNVGYLHW